jgi:hypothetical protein
MFQTFTYVYVLLIVHHKQKGIHFTIERLPITHNRDCRFLFGRKVTKRKGREEKRREETDAES